MSRRTAVQVTARFVGFHRWKDAPDRYDYLRHWHRHEFHVEMMVEVAGLNREVEFCDLKAKLQRHLYANYQDRQFEFSCEQIAHQIMDHFHNYPVTMVGVSEDGENGAYVYDDRKVQPKPIHSLADLRDLAARLAAKGKVAEGEVVTDEVTGHTFKVMSVAQDDPSPKPDATVDQNPCFVGVEAEGPHRGKPTLFVPGRTTPKQYQEAARKIGSVYPGWWQTWTVYYGAGNDRRLRADTLSSILTSVTPGQVTLELDSLDEMPEDLRKIVEQVQKDAPAPMTIVSMFAHDATRPESPWAKAVTTTLIKWWGRHGSFTTRKDDPLFMFDTPISKFCSK